MKLHSSIPMPQATALPLALITAYQSVVQVGRLQRQESVLIAPGGSDIGQLAVRIARECGAVLFATAADEVEWRVVVDVCGLPAEQVFLLTPGFSSDVLAASKGGVDVVLSSLTGGQRLEAARCLAPFGRFVDTAAASIRSGSGVQLPVKHCTYTAVDAMHLVVHSERAEEDEKTEERARRWKQALRQATEAIGNLGLLDQIGQAGVKMELRTFQVNQLKEAFEAVGDGSSKVVVRFGYDYGRPHALVKVCNHVLITQHFSYITSFHIRILHLPLYF